MWNLGCDVMIGQCGDETDNGVWEAKAHRNQIGVADWRQFHQPIDASAHLLDDALVPERIKHVTCDTVSDSLTHSKLATVLAEDFFRPFFHFWLQTNSLHLFASGNNMSDFSQEIKGNLKITETPDR